MDADIFVDIDKIEIDKISKNLADLAATLEEPGEVASSKNCDLDCSVIRPFEMKSQFVVEQEKELEKDTPPRKRSKSNRCTIKNCGICEQDCFKGENKNVWVNKLEKIMEILENENQREDISLKNDIYPFILSHRNIFHVDAHRSGFQAWKKQVYNCLFHNKQRFQKGRQDGCWRRVKKRRIQNLKKGILTPEQICSQILAASSENLLPELESFITPTYFEQGVFLKQECL